MKIPTLVNLCFMRKLLGSGAPQAMPGNDGAENITGYPVKVVTQPRKSLGHGGMPPQSGAYVPFVLFTCSKMPVHWAAAFSKVGKPFLP